MARVQDTSVVQAGAADPPAASPRVGILPWTLWGNQDCFDAHGSHPPPKGGAIDAVSMAQPISWGLVPREGVDARLGGPSRRRMLGDIAVGAPTADSPRADGAARGVPGAARRVTGPVLPCRPVMQSVRVASWEPHHDGW
jgi:hypothetical protein